MSKKNFFIKKKVFKIGKSLKKSNTKICNTYKITKTI